MTTKLINCTCSNSYQDQMYGGKKVANLTRKAPGEVYRCTVCGKETGGGGKKK